MPERRFGDVNIFNRNFTIGNVQRILHGERTQRQSSGNLWGQEGETKRIKERIFKPFASTQDAFIKLISRIKWSLIIYICLNFTLRFWGVCALCMCALGLGLGLYAHYLTCDMIRQCERADYSIPTHSIVFDNVE